VVSYVIILNSSTSDLKVYLQEIKFEDSKYDGNTKEGDTATEDCIARLSVDPDIKPDLHQ
jgi:hypothetical protein